MDGTREHHSEKGQPGSEDQKLNVFPHMWTLELGQMHQCGWTWIINKGRAHMGDIGIGRKPKT
jgi:hypothetical protein